MKDADRLSAQMLELSVRNFSLINNTPVVRAGDQLGFASMGGDFAEFERQAKAIAKVQNERINERTEMIKAAGNAAKYPAAARKMGLPVDNPDALKQRVAELEAEVARLRNPDADLFRELAKEAGVKLPEAAAPAGAAQQGGELFGNETPFNLSGETQPAQETAEDKPLPDTGTMEMFGDETRSTPPTEMDRQNEANRDQTKGMPAAGGQRPANRLGIGKSKEDLTPAERAAEQRFTDEMNGRSDRENDELYDRQEGAAGGRVWNTDAARRMAKGEGATSRATQEAAGKYVRDRFYREMAKPVKKDGETITFLAGGPGSGKTSSLPDGFKGRVFDTTLSNPEEAGRMIEAALKSGRNVKIVYTHRPVEAAADLAFARAADKSSPDYGRVMGVEYFGKAHHNSQKTIQALAGKYKGDNRVEIEVWDNSGGKGSNRLAAEGVDFFGKEGISYDNDIDSTVRRAKEGFRRNRRGDNGEPLADDTGNAGTREAGKQGVAPADGRAAEGTGGGGEAGGAGQGQGNNPVGGGAGVGVPSAEERRQYDAVVAQWTKRDGTKKPGWMKAPNGKDTNLTELQWVHVRTPSFKRWFGDWENDPANASKVLDENGEPLVLYHGTPASFSVFDNSKGKSNTNAYGADKGFFFTSSRDVAMTYATRGGQVAGREPMAVFLRILNPYRYDLPNRPNQGYGAAIAERVYAVKKYFTGYDGLVSYNVTDPFEVSDVYAVFDNTAIKSATGNSGAYSRDNANIYGAPLQLTQPNPPAVNFDRPPDVRPGAGVNAPKTIMAFSAVVQSVGGSGAIRVGKLKKRKTLGEFWTFAATARVRIANDVGTAAHELAHALDQALFGRGNNWDGKTGGGGLSKPAQGELEKLGRDAYAGQKAPVGGYRSEGFAEFIRLSLTDPAQAAAKAPEFQKWWESQVVAKNHRLASALQEARAMGTLWFRQGSEERMRQQLAGPKTVQEKLAELKASRNKKLMEFERKFIEGAVFLRDFVNQAQAKAGGKIDEENNPYLTLTARRLTADSKARYMALRGMIDFWGNPTGGKALVDAFNRAGGEEKAHDFVLYLWARRALSLWDDPNGPRNPGIDREDAEYFMRKYDSPDFAAAAQMVYDWNNAVLDYSAQASPAYKRVVGFIRARDPGNYIPLFREFQELENRYAGARAGGVRGNDLLKRLKGSGRRIKPPVESMIAQAKTIILKADQIHVLEQAIAITENVEGMGHLLQEVSRDTIRQLGPTIESAVNAIDKKLAEIGAGLRIEQGTATTDEIMALAEESLAFFAKAVMPKNGEYGYIPMWRDGKVRWYEIEKGLYETLAVMDTSPVPFGGVGRVLNVAARTKRLGTTALRASFSLVTNPMRDFRTLYYNTRASDNPAVIFANWFGSFFSLAVNTVSGGKLFADNVFIKYKDVFDRLGLEMSGSLTQDARPVSRAAARVMRGGKLSLAPWKLASYGDYYDILLHVFQFGESAARVAEMKMVAQNMGWDPSQPMTPRVAAHLANAAKEVTTDFTKAGTFARQWNMLVPFINANIQGKVAHYEAIKRKGVAMWFFTRGLNLMLLSAANWWFNKDEEWWREMGEQERFSNDFVQTGDVLWRFPRAFEIDGFFLGGTAAILDAWYAREPERVREWFGLMFEQMSVVGSTKTGLNLDTLPPAAKEALEQAANYDTWRGRRIIPRMEEDRPAEEQYNEYTTRAAIEAGNILGVSPRRIDHMVNGVAGGVFSDATAIFGRGDEIMGSPVDREWEAADIPVFGRLFQRGGAAARNPVSIDKLYDAYGNALERQKSVKHEETEDERENRLGLTNAVRAIGNLEVIRMGTPDRKKRNELASLQIKIARTAVAASKGGKLDSWDYKTEAAEYKEAADEIKEARKAKRKAGGERR
ncbi:MAG: zeta toxin family protein [Opitutaceae bacterium]|nr:zeta toxin family protein [Opitutaceae bacterium]